MLIKFRFLLLFTFIAGCVEPYEFVVHDDEQTLVVEAFISDKSFSETLLYPSDGRYFTVKLSNTGDVTNTRPAPVIGAIVELLSSEGEVLIYTESGTGIYTLLNNAFKAKMDVTYRLRIVLEDENIYESGWEAMPDIEIPPMGEIGFSETEKQYYVMEANEWALRTKQVLLANIHVTENSTGETIRYRWTYSRMWVYVAPLVSTNDPYYRCWATDPYYLNTFGLQIDKAGGYKKDLFYFPTVPNARIFEKFSVLVTQHAMTESYFNFWKKMKDQNENSSLTDAPPFNLRTNFMSSTGANAVSGYFGVTSEQATRWYFDRTELSYSVPNTLRADCLVVYGPGPPAPECLNCTQYSFGKATTTKPSWWQP
ncbi:MAG: DUF4249 domain-containing protein [Cyclobacteriaceae bacterium]